MIRLRLRRFSYNREDKWLKMPLPFSRNNHDLEGYSQLIIISETTNYTKEYSEHQKTLHDPIYKKRIKLLRKELKEGFLYEDKNKDSNTHCLEIDAKFHYLSKDIDGHNRLTYYVYPPIKINDSQYITSVVLDHCTHHRDRVTSKLYSE